MESSQPQETRDNRYKFYDNILNRFFTSKTYLKSFFQKYSTFQQKPSRFAKFYTTKNWQNRFPHSFQYERTDFAQNTLIFLY